MDMKTPERRAMPRLRVEFRTTFSTSSKLEGTGNMLDLSMGGCRIESPVSVEPGVSLALRIYAPHIEWPLMVEAASVQWVTGQTFGLAFFRITEKEQQRLGQVVSATPANPIESKPIEPSISDAIHIGDTKISNELLLDRINKSHRWMIGLTAVIAVTGVLGWWVTWGQLDIMKGQIAEMITAMNRIASSMEESAKQSKTALDYTIEKSKLDQRAWVTISRAVINPPIVAGKTSYITITLKNSGKSPALKTRFRQAAKLVSELPRGLMPQVSSNKLIESVSVIGPDGTTMNHFALVPLSEWQVSLLNSGKGMIVTFGSITYFDIFDIKHDTTFCFFQQEVAKPELSPCEHWNEAS